MCAILGFVCYIFKSKIILMKPTLLNIMLFWLVKYVAFYSFMMFKTNNYAFIKVNEIKNGVDLFFYLWIFLFLPIVCMIILSVPLYFSLKASKINYFLLIVCITLIAEYIIYTYSASQADLMNGVYNSIISSCSYFYFTINILKYLLIKLFKNSKLFLLISDPHLFRKVIVISLCFGIRCK